MRLAWHTALAPDRVQQMLDRPMVHDRFGHRLHLVFALLLCFLIPFQTTVVQLAVAPLLVFFVLRTPHIWRTWASLFVQPLFLAVLAVILWAAITLLWTPDVRHGVRELASYRWATAMWLLWPVMMHRPLLIGALVMGFLCGNLAQAGHAVGLHTGIEWLTYDRDPSRISGWWDPATGGSMLVGALGLHLPAAFMGRGKWRLAGLIGSGVTLVGIAATGTRGAWIAAAALLILIAAFTIARRVMAGRMQARGDTEPRPPAHSDAPGRRRLPPALVVAMVSLAAGIVAWVAAGDAIKQRLADGRAELSRIVQEGDYESFTGGRVLMAQWALEAAREHPMGVGIGGYRAWVVSELEKRGEGRLAPYIHNHAHNAFLHIAATQGVVGIALALLVIALALRGGFSELRSAAAAGGDHLGTYSAGPGFALLGLLLVSAFDTVHLGGHTAPLLGVLLAMCVISRPKWNRP